LPGTRMKYRFMNEHRDQYSLVLMCRVLKVARAGFCQWLHKPLPDRAVEDQRLVEVIRNSCAASGGVYGARCVFGDLREAGETCGKHRVERLMRANKIKAVRGYKAPRHISGRPLDPLTEPT
jgi:putative transposase